jgi:N-acetylneuraminate synthase
MKKFKIGSREIGPGKPIFVIAEIGINHEGSVKKAKRMVRDAANSGAECVKFQMHVIEDEMSPEAKKAVPGNANESIWEIIERCSLAKEEHIEIRQYCEDLGLEYLCTPFSRAAADILESMGVNAYKIGSGECNNLPLVNHIASFGKPIILSTGMNNINSISKTVNMLKNRVPYALLHCTSMYPTPYEMVRLGALEDLKEFNVPIGLSDHSIGNYTSFGAVALGASIIEKHFTSNPNWKGPDILVSITPNELKDLIDGCEAIRLARGGKKGILEGEFPTINFAYSSVVSTKDIKKGEEVNEKNVWVKRPGTGEIAASGYEEVLGKRAKEDIKKDTQLRWDQLG